MCGTVAARHRRIAGQCGTTWQRELQPQYVVDEAKDEIENDVVRVVETRRQPEIGNVPDVRNRCQGAPCMIQGASVWTTWKARRAWVQVEESHASQVERVQDHECGRKVVQLLC
jgi:hypothetical protein